MIIQVSSGKLCESLSHIAGISADSGFVDDGHTRNEAQQGQSVVTIENERLQNPAVQALSVLSNVSYTPTHSLTQLGLIILHHNSLFYM